MTTKTKDDASGAANNDTTATTNAAPASTAKYYATRDFTDAGPEAGQERQFKKDAELTDVEPGALVNYVAGGLATTDKPAS